MTIGDPCIKLVRTPYKEVATHSLRTAGLDAKVQHTQAENSETIKKKKKLHAFLGLGRSYSLWN